MTVEPAVSGQPFWTIKNRAQALMDVERWHEAVQLLHQALELAPNDVGVLCPLALSYLKSGDGQTALRYAELAVESAPENEWGHRLRSIVLARMGRKKEALAAAEEAVRVAPAEPRALYTLSEAQRGCRKLREAAQTAERLRELAPEWKESHQALGLIALERKRPREAEEHCRRALAIDPTSYYSMNNLGVALLRTGRKKEAIECFHRAAKLRPSEPTARHNLKQAVNKYMPRIATGYGLWILFQVLRMASGNFGSGSPGLLVILFVPFLLLLLYLWRRRRLKDLPAEVQLYLQVERRRFWRINFSSRVLLVSCITILGGWLFFWLIDASGSARPEGAVGWAFLTLLLGGVLTGIWLQLRERMRRRS